MASLFTQRPGELRLPSIEQLSDGRYRMQRFRVYSAPVVQLLPYGARDTEVLFGEEAVKFRQMRLIRCEPGTLPDKPSVAATVDTYEQLIPFDDFEDLSITFPGVRPSAFQVRADFPFRSSAESKVVTVRIAHKFFVLKDPRRIPLVEEFSPRSLLDGNATSVLDDNTSPSSEEYLGMVASGTEFVDRCLVKRLRGDVWVRQTFYVKAR